MPLDDFIHDFLVALTHPGVKCAQYVALHFHSDEPHVKQLIVVSSILLGPGFTAQSVIQWTYAPIVNQLASQEISTPLMVDTLPPISSLRSVKSYTLYLSQT
jgi:hypothetical protein